MIHMIECTCARGDEKESAVGASLFQLRTHALCHPVVSDADE
jgi:hypothetical protein